MFEVIGNQKENFVLLSRTFYWTQVSYWDWYQIISYDTQPLTSED